MRPPKPSSTGFLCACGGKTMCIDSRQNKNGSTRRRRKCLSCGTRLTTHEISLEKYRHALLQLGDLAKQARVIMRGIGPETPNEIWVKD